MRTGKESFNGERAPEPAPGHTGRGAGIAAGVVPGPEAGRGLPDADMLLVRALSWAGSAGWVGDPAAWSLAVRLGLDAWHRPPPSAALVERVAAVQAATAAADASVGLLVPLVLADALRPTHPDASQALLRLVLAPAHEGLLDTALPAPPGVLAGLLGLAWQCGVERERVRALMRRHRLQPHPAEALHWPWPVRIHTLGRFGVVCDDQPLTFAGKPPRKALELLQALVANGGREVPVCQLIQNLWPDEPGDTKNLFDNTLHRLRKVLGPPDAIQLRNGKLTLDPAVVWVDIWSFHRLTSAFFSAPVPADGAQAEAQQREAAAALRLYTGHFLQSEPDAPWIATYRDRARSRFLRLVALLGERLQQQGRSREAVEVFERGLEVDNLAEPLYQQIMLCQQRRGEHAEVLRTYRRCRELLSIVLGVRPSWQTEQIRAASAQAGGIAGTAEPAA